jgi:hypothetical protein
MTTRIKISNLEQSVVSRVEEKSLNLINGGEQISQPHTITKFIDRPIPSPLIP